MVESRTNLFGDGLRIRVERGADPAHTQLEAALRDGIRTGRLPGGAALPATRRLAEQLGVSRGVVVEAYQQLTAEGYLQSRSGGYTRVADDVVAPPADGAEPVGVDRPGPGAIDLRYGRPDVANFPRAAWLRSLRRVLAEAPNDRLDYQDGRGAPELRAALAGYLNRVRGTWATPGRIVVCNGYAQALSLLFPVLAARGVRRIAMEDPADPDARRVAADAGLTVVPVPVDGAGLDTDRLAALRVQAVLVTPAHQFPRGAVLAPERRTALVAWARATGGLVVEDDYDAEYRYDATPVGAIQGLAPESVVYAGTASKTLAPGLRIGWMIAPAEIAAALAERKFAVDRGSPVIDQLAFAGFLEDGGFDRHLRRMRPHYRRRRDLLLAELAERMPELRPTGAAAGLHVYSDLPDDLPEARLLAAARERGLVVDGVAEYRVAPGPGGLLVGYGRVDDDGVRAGVRRLAEAADAVRGVRRPAAARR